jgi:predicted TIM-barrel fold metal-dependent hydrolase
MPAGACDTHVHVFGPAADFPYAPERGYTPGDAAVADLLRLQSVLRLVRVGPVQPSPYGTDNARMLAGPRAAGAGRRGIDPAAPAALGIDQPGFAALTSLVASGRAYVKLSAPCRISKAPDYADVAVLARSLIRANPDRMLWGTDWPHTSTRRDPSRATAAIETFQPEDDGRAVDEIIYPRVRPAGRPRRTGRYPARCRRSG